MALLLGPFVLHAISLAGSSHVEEEQYTAHYLTCTMMLIHARWVWAHTEVRVVYLVYLVYLTRTTMLAHAR
eukprot:1176449-Prorocentrum_minimum.AAC.2